MSYDSLQRQYQDSPGYEILNGNIVNMSPASTGHTTVTGNLHGMMFQYFRKKTCRIFVDGLSVHFSKEDKPVPDIMVVCNPEIIQKDGIHGAPDFIAEVLSPSTAFRDKRYKKELYQLHGVREYWIIDPKSCSVEVYQLLDGKYELNQVYVRHAPEDISLLSEEERRKLPQAIQPCIFPDLSISLDDIFENV